MIVATLSLLIAGMNKTIYLYVVSYKIPAAVS
jgi:hypothetical protein